MKEGIKNTQMAETDNRNKSTTRDMTVGSILLQLVAFAVPLLFGNIFQMLYNTVDALVVGNFVGKEALAAIGSTTVIVNIMILFFNGVAIGGGVVISTYFGAKKMEKLHSSVETTMAVTLAAGVLFTVAGVALVPFMLRFMATPEDVFGPAKTYLQIYFSGSMGLLVYNMGSGILRAVGDTRRPLYFLVFTSILNILLDLLFVIPLKMGIAGAALATIISQFISAAMVLYLLTTTKDIYRLVWKDLSIDLAIFRQVLSIGLPAGLQAMLTAFSNVFVQSYINSFGSDCMAGWSCYNKLDSFIFLPVGSLNQAATTFVSQNIGAGQHKRAEQGTVRAIQITVLVTAFVTTMLFIFAPTASSWFTKEGSVIEFSVLFIRTNVYFLVFNGVAHVLAGALRGRGDSKGPMFIMLSCFVALRQIYLFIVSRTYNTPRVIGFGYPVGWMACFVTELIYYMYVRKRKMR